MTRSTHNSRGTFVDRTICASERNALVTADTPPLNQAQISWPLTR